MPKQTIQEWRNSAKRMKVKGSPFEGDWNLEENGAIEIIVYNWDGADGCDGYIEVHKYYSIDPVSKEMNDFTAFYLILERDEYISFYQSDLEEKLYAWLLGEGVFNTKEEQRDQNIEIDVHNINLEMGVYLAHKYNPESGDVSPGAQINFDTALADYLRHWQHMNNVWEANYKGPGRAAVVHDRMMKERENASR